MSIAQSRNAQQQFIKTWVIYNKNNPTKLREKIYFARFTLDWDVESCSGMIILSKNDFLLWWTKICLWIMSLWVSSCELQFLISDFLISCKQCIRVDLFHK